MRTVGVRELKNRLSEYLRAVRGGDQVLVTDRGAVTAELRAPGQPGQELPYPGLMELVRRGAAQLGALNAPDVYPGLPSLIGEGEASRLLAEERGEE